MNFQNIPFDDIVKVGQKTLLDSNLFTVSWILGRFCNYNCSYCWPYARSNIQNYQEYNIYCTAIETIKRQARNNGFSNFHFSFSGGEPTAYKRLLDLTKFYADDADPDYQSIHMTTNLSPAIKWWKKWIEKTNTLQRKSITASYHAEFANEQEFIDKCLFLQENNVFVTINQVMVPELFDNLYNRCKRFFDAGINVTLKPQSNKTATEIVAGYTDSHIKKMQVGFPQRWKDTMVNQIELLDNNKNKYFIDQAERFNAFGFNKFKGWCCNAGYQSIIIKENEVKRSYSCHDKIIGNITDDFKIFSQPKQCLTPTCVSSADSKIPKEKNGNC